MRNLLFILFFSSSTVAISQTYQGYTPLPKDTSTFWRESGTVTFGMNGSCFDYYYDIKGDTLINNIIYHAIQKVGIEREIYGTACGNLLNYINEPAGYFRNDSSNKKVYYINPQIGINQDTLLYDFDIDKDDTLLDSYLTGGGTHIVDSVDTVNVSGSLRKRFFINDLCQSGVDPILIEGVGSSYGLLYDLDCSLCCFNSLVCVSSQGRTIYPDSSTSCNIVTSLNEVKENNQTLIISPNPTNGIINLKSTENIQSIEIYNLQGQKVQEISPQKRRWELPEKSGLYLIRIQDEEGRIFTEKIIKN